MALLVSVPLLSLILIRMLWSGSSLWFLTVGIILLGSAAVLFLARRQDDYGLAQEPSRVPLVLAGLGVVFLAMLLLPNYADGGSGTSSGDLARLQSQLQQQQVQQQQQQSSANTSQVSGVQQQPTVAQAVQQPVQQLPVAQQPDPASSVSGETYIVVDGDTLWDIATNYGVTVEAIVAANSLADESDIQIGQELIIPPPDEDAIAEEIGDGAQ
jgi:LysM repeat protein